MKRIFAFVTLSLFSLSAFAVTCTYVGNGEPKLHKPETGGSITLMGPELQKLYDQLPSATARRMSAQTDINAPSGWLKFGSDYRCAKVESPAKYQCYVDIQYLDAAKTRFKANQDFSMIGRSNPCVVSTFNGDTGIFEMSANGNKLKFEMNSAGLLNQISSEPTGGSSGLKDVFENPSGLRGVFQKTSTAPGG